jgi:hypothetical protein
MANAVYNSYKDGCIEGEIAFLTDTIKVGLVTSTYTVDIDSDTLWSDITNEVVGTGYTAGGATLASKTSTQDNTNDRGVMDAADVTWSTSTVTARAAVVYESGTGYLIGYIDFAADKSSSASDFTIQWHADGILYIS